MNLLTIKWWTVQICWVVVSVFFTIFGIDLLRAAYHLNHPSYFLLTFFSSNLIILISGAILAGMLVRIYLRFRPAKTNSDPGQGDVISDENPAEKETEHPKS
ncbi:MAG: hypothetical protein HQK59_10300 [Deltaproteobacteria bacterium]|nr:hypothetical protein [Deltaproteobacteria bacterium]